MATTLTVEPGCRSTATVRPDLMAIGELAGRAGVPTSTVRHYEREGLIEPDARRSGQRRYAAASLRRLLFVGLLQDAGLSLREIRGVLEASSVAEWKAIGHARLRALDAEIAQLEHARRYLEGALRCPFDHPLTDCGVMGAEIDRRMAARTPR